MGREEVLKVQSYCNVSMNVKFRKPRKEVLWSEAPDVVWSFGGQ